MTPLGSLSAVAYFRQKGDEANWQNALESLSVERKLSRELNALAAEAEPIFASLGQVTEAQGRCPRCAGPRTPAMFHTIDGRRTGLRDKTLGAIGIPPWDVLGGRAGWVQRFYEFRGDRDDLLGPLFDH